jgi:hypothetical protein
MNYLNTLISYLFSAILQNPRTIGIPLALGITAVVCARRYWFGEVRSVGRRAAKL